MNKYNRIANELFEMSVRLRELSYGLEGEENEREKS